MDCEVVRVTLAPGKSVNETVPIEPGMMSELVSVPSWTLSAVTASPASSGVPTAPAPISGFG